MKVKVNVSQLNDVCLKQIHVGVVISLRVRKMFYFRNTTETLCRRKRGRGAEGQGENKLIFCTAVAFIFH